MYILDTNICIYLMKNSFPSLTDKLLNTSPDKISLSAVSVFELEYGASKSNWSESTRDNLYSFLSPFRILPFDSGDALTAGRLRAMMTKQGSPIGPYDIMIAAQGVSRDLVVVTHNTREFSRVPGLKVEDWVQLS